MPSAAKRVMCTKCGKWVYDRCAKTKRVTSTLVKGFVCKLCVHTKEGNDFLTRFIPCEYDFLTRLTL